MGDQLLTQKQAADRLGISQPTISRLVKSGALSYYRPSIRTVRFSEDQLRAYLRKHEYPRCNEK